MEKLKVNPWLSMWTSPRKTIKAIVKANPKYRFALLSAIYGFPMMLHFSQSASFGEKVPFFGVLLISLVLATFVGMLGITITSALLTWTGKWIGGKAPFINVRAAVAWSNVTNVPNIVLWLILTAVFGVNLFVHSFPYTEFMGYQLGVVTTVYILQTVLAVWSFVILLHSLGEVQGFSAWKALLNVIIPFVLVFAAVFLFSLIIWMLNGMP